MPVSMGTNSDDYFSGADTIIGAGGDDTLLGSNLGDLIFGENGTSDAGSVTVLPGSVIEFQVNASATGDQYHAQFAQLSGGGFIATWFTAAVAGTGPAQVMAQMFDANSNPVGPEFQVSTGPVNGYFLTNGVVNLPVGTPDDYRFETPSVVELAGGGFVVTWTDLANGYNIHARIYDAAGNAGTEFVVNPAPGNIRSGPQVTALADGGFAVVYHSNYTTGINDVILQTFDSTGAPVVPITIVDQNTTSAQGTASITQLDNGNLFVTWTSQGQGETANTSPYFVGNVYGRIVDVSSGVVVPVTPEFLINSSDQADSQQRSKVATIAGGFVVVWQSWDPANQTENEIHLQRYLNDGTADGPMVVVNTTTANNQNLPEIAALTDGGYIVVWQSELQDGAGYGIYQQRYAADGSAMGGEVQVNITTTLDQRSPTVAALDDGGWAVGYNVEGGLDSDGYGVFSVRFDADGNPVGQGAPSVPGDDFIDASFGSDTAYGNAGDDTLLGGSGEDSLYGGLGDDSLDGQWDDDMLTGADGDDSLEGAQGDDTLDGGAGHDEVLGGAGRDVASGSDGDDTLSGGTGGDTLRGGNHNDEMSGGAGHDTGFGDAGSDLMQGGTGRDTLTGGAGKDSLEGDQGADRLLGGTGKDALTGGAGADVFVFAINADSGLGSAADVITDFAHGIDQIDLSAFGNLAFTTAPGFANGGTAEVRYNQTTSTLLVNTDGVSGADFAVKLAFGTLLTAGDLIL